MKTIISITRGSAPWAANICVHIVPKILLNINSNSRGCAPCVTIKMMLNFKNNYNENKYQARGVAPYVTTNFSPNITSNLRGCAPSVTSKIVLKISSKLGESSLLLLNFRTILQVTTGLRPFVTCKISPKIRTNIRNNAQYLV